MFCRHCRYPLNTLTTDRCPECGVIFDRADDSTWLMHPMDRTVEEIRDFTLAGVGWVTIMGLSVFTLLWVVLIVTMIYLEF